MAWLELMALVRYECWGGNMNFAEEVFRGIKGW